MHEFLLNKTPISVTGYFSLDTKHVKPNINVLVIQLARTELFVFSPCNWISNISSSPLHRQSGAALKLHYTRTSNEAPVTCTVYQNFWDSLMQNMSQQRQQWFA